MDNICPAKYIDTPYCRCSSCEKWLNSFTSYIDNNIESFRSDLITCINDEEDKNKHNTLSLEQLYKIHKNSLTKTESELLNLKPKSIDDIYILIDEMNNRKQKKQSKDKIFKELIKHGIIYEMIDENLLITNIENYIKKYYKLLKLIDSNKILKIFGGIFGSHTKEIAPPYSIHYTTTDGMYDYINFCIMEINSIKRYHLNDFYFNSEPQIVVPKRYNIFNSTPEAILFNHLSRMYPDYIICPNIPLRNFIKISKLSEHFTEEEINYLRYCIIDFVIANKEGYVVKCIELQKGNHHDNKEWIYKDSLKRKCFDILGIDFSYEY